MEKRNGREWMERDGKERGISLNPHREILHTGTATSETSGFEVD